MAKNKVKIDDIIIGDDYLVFIGGPCVIENEKMILQTADGIKQICKRLNIPFIFKSSYDKANRTSIKSYRGPGLKRGLEILKKVKRELKIKLLIDVHCRTEVKPVSEITDIIQIPAFLCRQTDLLITAAKTGKPVNVKKGQFLSPESVFNIFEKLKAGGCKQMMITERGTTFGYGRLVVDMAGIPIMKKFGYPVVFDATHSAQMPSVGTKHTLGQREVIPSLVYAGIAAGADALYMEVHPKPSKAKSDKETQWYLDKLEPLLEKAKKIFETVRR